MVGRMSRDFYHKKFIALGGLAYFVTYYWEIYQKLPFNEIVFFTFHVLNFLGAVARAHNIGKRWWWLLIPFFNIYLLFPDGQPFPNRWGPDPLGRNEKV